ncbi:delta(14)-sterol reductase isoform X2 [Lingula anatina]|uniref:Delta(14)-sterol reductase n=1 Tax=Lingula anatina TaxID=7574 RepID=A0A1S3HT59_LINAN|nr:delta(14)-sterol reductase isoform X2 [Lingula anatina]XP_013389226.1 delta(14)-sterol reductase isoform X2 [Lingula anatina]|eukprot:XP_013389225.1 delta(14)-sterol reductase isoform X2 [Lingula anatina]
MPGTPARPAKQAMSNFTRSSRSRSRSRSRGRSPGRKSKASPSRKAKQSPSPARKPRSSSKSRSSSKTRAAATPSTPTRQSARLAEKQTNGPEEVEKKPEMERKPSPARPAVATPVADKPVADKPVADSEFGGPVGAFFCIVLLPATVYVINIMCTEKSCTLAIPSIPKKLSNYFDSKAVMIGLGWFVFQVVLAVLPVGKVVSGQPVKGLQRLQYRCNGFIALMVSLVALGVGQAYFKVDLSTVHTLWLQLITTAIVFSVVLSLVLYIRARSAKPNALAFAASGNAIYDFWMGRELNPRIGSFDWKFFCELRPGLIGWVAINMCFLAEAYGSKSGWPNYPLIMVCGFQLLYVADALWSEEAILTTMDIIHEGFGFMLCFGDLAWVPFLYSLQPRFLLEHPQSLPWWALSAVALLNMIGFLIFRGSNSQKNMFRKNPYDPALAHLESMPTNVPGKRLLVSGWWGLCRHPNYLGDLIIGLAWSLPCGFSSLLPYFYPIYFFILLVHRAMRDDAMCRKKYGAHWDHYCERVKYVIIPYVY